jgi:putative membrane protein
MKKRFENYPKFLLGLFLVIWIFLSFSPRYVDVWVAENILVVLFVLLLVFSYRKFRFSNLSYSLFFVLLVLHIFGAYYTYTEMPLFDLVASWLGLARNHYDRVIHFLFGFLFFIPTYEFLSRKFNVKGFWGFLVAFLLVTSLKGIYEVFEWLYLVVREESILGTHFLGMQGDQWDAQKDIVLGMIGSIVAWIILGLKSLRR